MEVKKEITMDTRGGRRTFVVTPDMGNVMLRNSMNSVPPGQRRDRSIAGSYCIKVCFPWQQKYRGGRKAVCKKK
jgi:hypothetical protein